MTRESAAAALAPFLAADGCVVSLQNGLNELAIAAKVGERRTVGAFINFGADYLSPGVIHYAGRGAVVVGEIDGKVTPRAEALHRLLLQFDDRAMLTSNIWGYLWSKLGYGAMLIATALTDASIADCLASERHRPLLIALGREVMAVAVAAGIKPEAFNGFDPARLPARCKHGGRRSPRSTPWSPSTAARPRAIAASIAISPCASARPRCEPSSARSSRPAGAMAWPRRSPRGWSSSSAISRRAGGRWPGDRPCWMSWARPKPPARAA